MSDESVLGERRRALEEEFFRKENERLRERLREQAEREGLKRELREVSGIEDEAVLERLVELGVGAETVAALSLVPLVEVAWADGRLDRREKDAVLDAAREAGIDQSHPCHDLLAAWLAQRPEPRMLEAWSTYVEGLAPQLGPEGMAQLRERLLRRARGVAEAAGRLLGLGNPVSPEEEKVLGLLERTLRGQESSGGSS